MPVVDPPAKVLVTGSNGFIAIWIVRTLLERGFSVRGTIRSESKGKHLLNLFKDEVRSSKFELVVVPDFTDPSAFDSAVRGVDAILHTASPAHHTADDPNGRGFIDTIYFSQLKILFVRDHCPCSEWYSRGFRISTQIRVSLLLI